MSDIFRIPVIKDGELVQVLIVDKSLSVAGLMRLVAAVAPGFQVRAVPKESA